MNRTGILTRISALIFLVVTLCLALPAVALAIPRDVVIARGQVWVDKNVPYSQSRYATVDGVLIPTTTLNPQTLGYRTDCSGFASMCYDLRYDSGAPKSLNTASLPTVSTKITQAELLPGDMVLKPGTHVAIFLRWADDARTSYWTLEEGSTATGSVSRIRSYDKDIAAGYAPYRYNGIEDDFADVLDSVSGSDRFDTAAKASQVAFSEPGSASAAIVANGLSWPDALGGAALSGAADGPLLLTTANSLPASTINEIKRLAPTRIYLLGGTSVVSESVETALRALVPDVVRLGGRTRYETSAIVGNEAVTTARANGRSVDAAFVATGEDFPDALAASPLSAHTARPVLLTDPSALSSETLSVIKELGLTKVTVVGGENSVAPAVDSALQAAGIGVTRVAARDRYRTALAIAEEGERLGLNWRNVGVASGTSFADALSGGAAQGVGGSLMVLTPSNGLDPNVETVLFDRRLEIERPRVYGGRGAVNQDVRERLAVIFRTR